MDLNAEVMQTVKELKDKINSIAESKGQKEGIVNADAIHNAEIAKMKEEILAEVEKKNAESKMPKQEIVPVKKQGMKLSEFLLKAKMNHSDLTDLYIKTSMSEGTAAQGGYTVPVEYSDMIVGELNNPSYVLNKFTTLVHNFGYIKYLPKWLTDLTVYWVAESTAKTQSKPTLTRLTSTLKKLCAIITATDEYIQDDITGMEAQLAKLVAQNMALELERVAFIGSTVAGDAFNGIFYSTPHSETQTGAHLIYSDIVKLINHNDMNEIYRQGAEIFCNRTMVGALMGIVDSTGRPIWNMQLNAQGLLQNTVLGLPVTVCSEITNTCSTLGVKSVMFYGNPKYVMIGKKGGVGDGIELLVTQHGIISSSTSVSTNLWQQDETGYRFVMRRSVVPIGEAYTVLDEAVI